jgi:hypothetical protein
MKPSRIAALIVGCLLILPSLGLLFFGGALLVYSATERDDQGYFSVDLDRFETSTVAITAEEIDLLGDSFLADDEDDPGRLFDWLDADFRLRATSADGTGGLSIGIAPETVVDDYLDGIAHDEIIDYTEETPEYRRSDGSIEITRPFAEVDWVVATTGPGTQELVWTLASGRWSVVVMNADASPGVAADVEVGFRSDRVVPVAWALVGVGALLTLISVGLIAFVARRDDEIPPPPAGSPAEMTALARIEGETTKVSPVAVNASIDPALSPWQWLVKWLLAIPHVLVLFFLWLAFSVITVVAGFSILFTGRYPRSLFDFNLGVLRWTWRVVFYAGWGGLGTDRYPPFSLGAVPDYPATLDIAYPDSLSRGLVLVKWWLLAIPHYVIVGILLGGGAAAGAENSTGLLPILALIAGVIMLIKGRYPRGLFAMIVGLNRWVYRVVAYAALMTDDYPPFRLDQGGGEPSPPQPVPGADAPSSDGTVA